MIEQVLACLGPGRGKQKALLPDWASRAGESGLFESAGGCAALLDDLRSGVGPILAFHSGRACAESLEVSSEPGT